VVQVHPGPPFFPNCLALVVAADLVTVPNRVPQLFQVRPYNRIQGRFAAIRICEECSNIFLLK